MWDVPFVQISPRMRTAYMYSEHLLSTYRVIRHCTHYCRIENVQNAPSNFCKALGNSFSDNYDLFSV